MDNQNNKTALVTGSAGFIGFHISKRLIDEGWRVVGIDCMSDYYDVSLKERREGMLLQSAAYRSLHKKIEDRDVLMNLFEHERPNVVIHLAAQAGVRYSLENPRAYLESNINGTFELLEAARAFPPEHILAASTSSAYGANVKMPYNELMRADQQLSFYAATKKACENMAHSYSHLFELPITMFRFFTVYGPWGRPDMAPMKFAKRILSGEKIDIYNYGRMKRDFTYIDDLVEAIVRLNAVIPKHKSSKQNLHELDSMSSVAPFRIVNIGNANPIKLMDFIKEMEFQLQTKANHNYLPMQSGDMKETWADVSLLKNLTGFIPSTTLRVGMERFCAWYIEQEA